MRRRSRMRFPQQLGEVARQELGALGLAERLREAEIWRCWPEVVGPVVAARAAPLRIIRGTLTVAVSSGPWLQELRYLADTMRDKLNERLGGEVVREILFRSGRVEQAAEPPQESAPRKKKLTARQIEVIDGLSAEIVDPETRQAFADLMKTSLKDPRSS